MRNIKASFFNFVNRLRKVKKFNYARCNDLFPRVAHVSNDMIIGDIYSNRIDIGTVFFHYFQVNLKRTKINPLQSGIKKTLHYIYYFGYRPLPRARHKLILNNLPDISWLSKESILTFMTANLTSDISKAVPRNNILRKAAFTINGRLFNHANFLKERMNGWALCSIFLWPDTLPPDNRRETHIIFHIFGIYKRNKDLLNVEIKFFKPRPDRKILLREAARNASGSISSVDKKRRYIIIIHMNKRSKESGINDRKEIEAMLAEITLGLKYYPGIFEL